MFPTWECGEHCMQRARNLPHAASTSSQTWRFCWEAGIFQVAQWQFQLHHYILFTDKVQFNRDGVNNTHNSHVWEDENPHTTVERNFQLCFSVNVWCAVLGEELIGPFILEGLLTGKAYLRFLQEELSKLLEDVPLNKRGRIYFQHDGVHPHSSRQVRNFLNYSFPGQWIRHGSPHHWPARSPDISPLVYCVWGWMKELVYSVKMVIQDALLGCIVDAADHIRNSQWKLQWATRAFHNRAAASVAASGGIFKNKF